MKNILGIKTGLTERELSHILSTKPQFILDAINKHDALYNPRMRVFVERGTHIAKIQMDVGSSCTYTTTMPYDSSFYHECISLYEAEIYIEGYKAGHKMFSLGLWSSRNGKPVN